MTSTPTDGTSRDRRGWRAIGALLALLVLVAGACWASAQGYVSWTGADCTDEGIGPATPYAELVTDYDKSPYCARAVRNETWF